MYVCGLGFRVIVSINKRLHVCPNRTAMSLNTWVRKCHHDAHCSSPVWWTRDLFLFLFFQFCGFKILGTFPHFLKAIIPNLQIFKKNPKLSTFFLKINTMWKFTPIEKHWYRPIYKKLQCPTDWGFFNFEGYNFLY